MQMPIAAINNRTAWEEASPRDQAWFMMGRVAGLCRAAAMDFNALRMPTHWTPEDIEATRAVYTRGYESGAADLPTDANMGEAIREAEGLVAFANDPTRANTLLADLRAERMAFQSDHSKF